MDLTRLNFHVEPMVEMVAMEEAEEMVLQAQMQEQEDMFKLLFQN